MATKKILSTFTSTSAFGYRLPYLRLIQHNDFRSPIKPGTFSFSKGKKPWPSSLNPMWRALQPFRLSFKAFDFYKFFQRYYPFPIPSRNSLFRAQSRIFVFWYQFNLGTYCMALDFGAKQKKSLYENALWLRQSHRSNSQNLNFWSFVQRNSSFRFPYSLFFVNSNGRSPFFNFFSLKSSSFWFEEQVANLRMYGWNFYSRVNTMSLPSFLSQSSFDPKVLKKQSRWSSTSLWLSSPIHDYSSIIPCYLLTSTVIMPEYFFQFFSQQRRMKSLWSQLFFNFWTFSSKAFSFASFSLLNFSKDFYFFYLKSRFYFYFFSIFFWGLTFPINFFSFNVPLKFVAGSMPYRSAFLPLISSENVGGGPSFSFRDGEDTEGEVFSPELAYESCNFLSTFPNNQLYLRYYRRHFFLSSSVATAAFSLEDRLWNLNYFFFYFSQSYLLNSMEPFHYLFLWAFCLQELPFDFSDPKRYAHMFFFDSPSFVPSKAVSVGH